MHWGEVVDIARQHHSRVEPLGLQGDVVLAIGDLPGLDHLLVKRT